MDIYLKGEDQELEHIQHTYRRGGKAGVGSWSCQSSRPQTPVVQQQDPSRLVPRLTAIRSRIAGPEEICTISTASARGSQQHQSRLLSTSIGGLTEMLSFAHTLVAPYAVSVLHNAWRAPSTIRYASTAQGIGRIGPYAI
eukprot:2410918-Rhodomonas_salina.6